MIKIGVLGAGHLGKIHIKLLSQSKDFDLLGFCDLDEENATKVAQAYGIEHFGSLDQLLAKVDAVAVITPTAEHYSCAEASLLAGKHVFIEKPVTSTLDEAEKLLALAEDRGLQVQVGHVERFNPAYLSVKDRIKQPMFIESHRLAPFNPRGTDVSVVLDLMIHDLDIILSMVDSEISEIRSSGVALLSEEEDIANARIEFVNGCVANLTASRMSMKSMRKMRIFQSDAYVSVDFLDKKSQIIRLSSSEITDMPSQLIETAEGLANRYVGFEIPEIPEVNSIGMELELFAKSINTGSVPVVSLKDGYRALKAAMTILKNLESNRVPIT